MSHDVCKNILEKIRVPYHLGMYCMNKCLQPEQEITSQLANLASKVSGVLSLHKDLRLYASEKNFTPTKVIIKLCFLPPHLLLFNFFIEIKCLVFIHVCLSSIYIIRSSKDNRKYLTSYWPLSMTMACSAKSIHSIKLILFPVCSTSIENACVFVPNFWSQMECCPDVGSTLQEGGISESPGERCCRLPSLGHQYYLPNMTVCDISNPFRENQNV